MFEDDGFSPAKALTSVKKLVEQDKVFMIFGLSGSNPTIGTLDYAARSKNSELYRDRVGAAGHSAF